MTGQGTIENPYIIMNWDDFFNTDGDTVDTYYKLGVNLDGNDYNDGIFGDSHNVHPNIDGDGFEIRNILYTKGSAQGSTGIFYFPILGGSWENLRIVNVQTDVSLFWHSGSSGYISFRNCEIDAFCYSIGGNNMGSLFLACKLSLECEAHIGNMQTTQNYTVGFSFCSVNAKITNPSRYCTNFYSNNSELIIEYAKITVSVSSYRMILNGYNVLRFKFDPEQTQSLNIGCNSNISIMDDDLFNNVPATISGNGKIVRLSTSDMKNSDAVRATGFPVMVVTKE